MRNAIACANGTVEVTSLVSWIERFGVGCVVSRKNGGSPALVVISRRSGQGDSGMPTFEEAMLFIEFVGTMKR